MNDLPIQVRLIQEELYRPTRRKRRYPKKNSLLHHISDKVKNYLVIFLETTSIHGLNHLVVSGRHPVEILLWLIILALSIFGSVYLSASTWLRYQNSPTVISMDRDMFAWNTSFPAATICPDPKIDPHKLLIYLRNSQEPDKEKLKAFILSLANATYENFDKIELYDGISPDKFMETILNLSVTFKPTLFIGATGFTLHIQPTVTEMGLCYSINSEVAIYNSPLYRAQNRWETIKSANTTLLIHPLDGEVFVQVLNLSTAYNAYIHGPLEVPDFVTKHYYSGDGYYMKLYETAFTVYTSPEAAGLSVAQRKCRFPKENNLQHNSVYSYNMCRMECRIGLSLKYCNCIPHFYRKIGNEKICDAAGLHCLSNYEALLSNLHLETGERVDCDCLPLCDDVNYVIQSYVLQKWILGTNFQWGIETYPRMRSRRDIIFGFTDVLVAVGSMAGLFLGCSVLSFMEIIYFMSLRLFWYISVEESYKMFDNRNLYPAKRDEQLSFLKRLKTKVRVYLVDFLDTSTIHGLKHLISSRRHSLEILLWLIVLGLSVYGSVYLSVSTWLRYQYSSTVVSVDRDMFAWNTTFPSVTICPHNKIDPNKLKEFLDNSVEFDKEKLETFIRALANATYKNFDTIPEYGGIAPRMYMNTLLNMAINFSPTLTVGASGISMNFQPTITEMGLCYAVNSNVAIYNSPEYRSANRWDLVKNDMKTLFVHPLDGEVFAQILNLSTSYDVFIHGPLEVPDIATKHEYSDKDFYMKITVTAMTVYTTPEAAKLSVAQRKCRFFNDNNLLHNSVYTYNMCRMECRIRLCLKYCNCVPHFYRTIGFEQVCNISGLHCLSKYRDKLFSLRLENKEKISCDCLPNCDDTNYVIQSNALQKWFLGTNLQWGIINYPRMRYRRDIIFGFTDVLVAVGSMAGLFLGCSVLSFMEIVYFLTLRLFWFIIRK